MTTEEEIRRLVTLVVDEVTAGGKSADETIAIGADHGGYHLKQSLIGHLEGQGLGIHDCGCVSTDAVDYPDFAHAVANLVGTGVCRWGVIIDGAGIGSCMVANKVPGVRAALCYDLSSARNSREHNHANVVTLGAHCYFADTDNIVLSEINNRDEIYKSIKEFLGKGR